MRPMYSMFFCAVIERPILSFRLDCYTLEGMCLSGKESINRSVADSMQHLCPHESTVSTVQQKAHL